MHHHHSDMASQTVTNALLKCNKKPYLGEICGPLGCDERWRLKGAGLIQASDAFSSVVASQVDQLMPSALSASPGEKGAWMPVQTEGGLDK